MADNSDDYSYDYEYLYKIVLIGDSGVGNLTCYHDSPVMSLIWKVDQLLVLNLLREH